jgi:multidrug efflux pump subunit AcrB
MTMIGIISLAGVVVNNAIVLADYANQVIDRKKADLKLDLEAYLPVDDLAAALVLAGKTRLRPVLLTAITTILGLLPLATGMNLNFYTLISQNDLQIYFGGDNVAFWGPICWTVIYGLTFATFLTLVIVPVMLYLSEVGKSRRYWSKIEKEV